MIKFLKLSAPTAVVLLVGCQQQFFDCEKQKLEIQALEQKLAARIQPVNKHDAKLTQQLEQVTRELVEVKVQRDLVKQELAALRKYNLKK